MDRVGVDGMNEQRKKIIVAEIKYWKQSKLLPDQYCDFLLALYSQGDQQETEEITVKDSLREKEKSKMWNRVVWLGIIGAALLVSLFLLPDQQVLPTALVTIFAVFLLVGGRLFNIGENDARPALFAIASLLLLSVSLHSWDAFFPSNTFILIGLLILNCVLWLGIGRKHQLIFFTISGYVGLVLVGIFLVL